MIAEMIEPYMYGFMFGWAGGMLAACFIIRGALHQFYRDISRKIENIGLGD